MNSAREISLAGASGLYEEERDTWSSQSKSGVGSLFGRRSGQKQGSTKQGSTLLDLDTLITTFGQAAAACETIPDLEILIRARLSDSCRDNKIRPVSKEAFQQRWSELTLEQKHRFVIFVSALDIDCVAVRLAVHCGNDSDANAALTLLHLLAQRLDLLSAEVIQQSDIRLEEFARHFCAAWGLEIADEDQGQSQTRLHDIDFARLTEEANVARSSAEERLAYLRKLQEEQEQTRRPRRGKW